MTIQEAVAAKKALIDSLVGDYDAAVEATGAALQEITNYVAGADLPDDARQELLGHLAAGWKRAHRIRHAEQNAVEPDA